jgi:hypothetical protein
VHLLIFTALGAFGLGSEFIQAEVEVLRNREAENRVEQRSRGKVEEEVEMINNKKKPLNEGFFNIKFCFNLVVISF